MTSVDKPALTVGVALIRLLERLGVEHVFGIPGVHTIELYRGLAASSVQHHTPRHEQGAGFMADGYARVSGKPGVCFVITGPGLTNVVTPMGQALADSIPMLVISSVNDTLCTPHARGMLHEMPNQMALASEVTRFSQTISQADELPDALARAFSVFTSARPGPVHLQCPVTLLGSEAGQSLTELVHQLPSKPSAPDASIRSAAALLDQSDKPLILAGGGTIESGKAIQALAEKIDAPVHMTINSRGLLSYKHDLAVSATCTLPSVRQAVNEADVVLAIGTELAATDYDQYKDDGFHIDGQLIRCDIDPMQLNNNFVSHLGLTGDAQTTALALSDCVKARTGGEGRSRAKNTMSAAYKELDAAAHRHLKLLETLRDKIPGCVMVGDSTQLIYSGNMIFNTEQPRQWFNSSTGFGTLGYALPAATGAAIAAQEVAADTPVVCLIGDGGIQFVLGELGALKDTGLPVAVVVWCNNGYREIKTSMQNASVETVGVEFSVPDFLAVASAYGIKSVRVADENSLCNAIIQCYEQGESVVIEIDEDDFMAQ